MDGTEPNPHDGVSPTTKPDAAVSQDSEGEGGQVANELAGDGAGVQPSAETDIWTGRTHWKHFCGRLLLWLGGNMALAVLLNWIVSKMEGYSTSHALSVSAAVLVVSGVVVTGPIFWFIMSHRYRLTSQRLFIEKGVLTQTIDQTELIRVDDVRIYKTLVDRIFGLGSVAIMSTDASDREIMMKGIAAPEAAAEHIRTQMRAMRRKSLFVENL